MPYRIFIIIKSQGGIMTILTTSEIMALIPNRYPIIYIDRVEALEPDKKIVATKLLTINESFMRGYQPDQPQMPNTLIIEALAQTASILILKSPAYAGKTAYLGAAKQVDFGRKARPGDQLQLTVTLIKTKSNMGVVQTSATVDGENVCTAELTFVVGPRDSQLEKNRG